MQNDKRRMTALSVLHNYGIEHIEYLGQGMEGVVFHDGVFVYKVIVPFFEGGSKWSTYRHLTYFFEKGQYASFYNLIDVIETKDGFLIEKYPYEKSECVKEFTRKDCIRFLTECWKKKIIVQDCKKENFIRVNGIIKLVDMDACSYYSDDLFLNCCARMFILLYESENPNLKKLQRSAINNFNLPELTGLREFVNDVFVNIVYEESRGVVDALKIKEDESLTYETYSSESLPNLENLFFTKMKDNLYLTDIQVMGISLSKKNTFAVEKIAIGYRHIVPCRESVSLLIKTCAMDVTTIEENIKHIVRQLCFPRTFSEVVVSIDSKKENFIRQYTDDVDYDKTIQIVKRLQQKGIIDRYIIFNPESAGQINKKWFHLETLQTHSSSNVPVSSQLYAFEQCKGEYILQMDSDVMIGRRDFNHDYISDMIQEIQNADNVVSVGFNICNLESKPYFGFDNGGFVPEVRMSLFCKKRFFALRPLPNTLDKDGRLSLTWYRSMEQKQKDTGYCSIRGGNINTFFIHPQNYRKAESYAWMNILDRVEQLEIPDCQYGHFDCEGAFYDWCMPKRNEKLVVLSCFRNVRIDVFLRFWYSLMSQKFQEFGILLYDDHSDNGIPLLVEKLIAPYKGRVTFIKGRTCIPKLKCEYIALHNYCANPNSIIVSVDADDALIGDNVLYDVYKKYEMQGVDATCGRVHQTYRIQPHYRYPVDFLNPRKTGGNVWQHLKTFRKYLFDSIPLSYFMYTGESLKLSKRKWFEKCDDYAIMVPIVEMSSSPYQMDFINYYYERNFEERDAERELKNQCIAEILQKKTLLPESVILGRKTFISNAHKIEIDITFECNLKCKGCNRSCGFAPSSERMSLEDIRRFVKESRELDRHWAVINVLGGEPTLHPDFIQILEILQEYADSSNKGVVIQVVSNGFTEETRRLCQKATMFANVKIDYHSFKTGNVVDYFTPFADAPCDDAAFANADYSKGCWVSSYCGIGLNKNGYYACSVCGAIDRVQKGHNGAASLKEFSFKEQQEHFNKFCRLCGNFKHYSSNFGDFIPRSEKAPFHEIISPTWENLYKEYADG